MSAVIYMLRDWAEGWTPKEIYGGIHGRDSHALHETLMRVIDECNAKREDLLGGKIDLRKCFDTIAAEQAIALWEEWGAPSGVVRILRTFYLTHQRWVEYRGRVAQKPLRPVRSLLQGVPSEPATFGGPDVSMGGDHENKGARSQLWYLLRR